MGNNLGVNDLDDCDPIKTNKDLGDDIKSVSGRDLDPDAAAYPCGLVARSVFTDQFTSITDSSGKNFIIDDSDIAWESDVEYRYKNLGISDWKDIQWLNIEDCKLILMAFIIMQQTYLRNLSTIISKGEVFLFMPANLDSDCVTLLRLYRTFYGLDENGRSAKLQETVREDRPRHARRQL